MKNLKNNLASLAVLLVIALSFFPELSNAEDAVVEKVSNEEGVNFTCEAKREAVTDVLKEQPECFVDGDCVHFDYGYPFQPAPCMKAIMSNSQEKENIQKLAKVEEYRQKCIYSDDEENKKYMEFSQKLAKENSECKVQRVYCLKGFCRRKNYSVHYLDYGSSSRQLR